MDGEKTRSTLFKAHKDALRKALSGAFDGASDAEKIRAVEDVIRTSSIAAGALALQPVPAVDPFVLTPLQLKMTQGIARIRGYRLDGASVRKVFGMFHTRLVTPHLTLIAAKVVPVVPILPDLVAISVAYALTAAIGELGDLYFASGCSMPADEVRARLRVLYREQFGRTYRRQRNELRARFRRNPEVRRQVEELRRAHRAGTLSDREAERRLDELLGGAAPTQ